MAFVTDSLTELLGSGDPDKVYVVIIRDRDFDIDVEVYVNPHEAISHARRTAREYCRHEDDYEERSYKGYLFYASYSCEDDHTCVMERKLR